MPSVLHAEFHLVLTAALYERFTYVHFTDEETDWWRFNSLVLLLGNGSKPSLTYLACTALHNFIKSSVLSCP